MKAIFQSLVVLAALIGFTSCTAYVDADAATRTTTTTTRTTDNTFEPSATVTTERTTTRY